MGFRVLGLGFRVWVGFWGLGFGMFEHTAGFPAVGDDDEDVQKLQGFSYLSHIGIALSILRLVPKLSGMLEPYTLNPEIPFRGLRAP